jgi:hypothetical protein
MVRGGGFRCPQVVIMPRSRSPSDLSDAQLTILEPLLPPLNSIGRRPAHDRRELIDAIL